MEVVQLNQNKCAEPHAKRILRRASRAQGPARLSINFAKHPHPHPAGFAPLVRASMHDKGDKGHKPPPIAKHTAKHAARRAVRVAARAKTRLAALEEEDELVKLDEQLDDLDDESDVDTTAEYNMIKNRCTRLQVQWNQAATTEENKKLEFVCRMCFDECLIDCLRIATPCGHGFCEGCTDQLQAAADAAKPCPICRGPIASVMKAFF